MGEVKPLASLSGMLLARKGAARPAMRRPASVGQFGEASHQQDDLGWNDMGYDVDPSPDTPMDHDHHPARNPLAGAVPEANMEVREQQAMIARRLQAQAEVGFESLPVHIVETEQDEAPAPVVEPVAEIASPALSAPTPVVAATPPIPVAEAGNAPVKRAPAANRVKRALPGAKDKAAFTLRLDKERHLKLRLACAIGNRSAQMIVTEALDSYLENMPEIGQLASRIPAQAPSNS